MRQVNIVSNLLMVFFLKSRNDGLLIHFIGTKEIDDYAKDGGPEAV